MRTTYRTFLPLLLTAPLFCQGEVDLRTTAKKGSSVWLLQTMKMEQSFDVGGQQGETGQDVTRTVHVTVQDVDDKGLTVEVKLARVHGTMMLPMGMGDSEFDSAEPAAAEDEDSDPTGGMLSAVKKSMLAGVGKSFTAKVGTNGKVIALLDTKDMLADAGGGGMMAGSGITEDTLREITEAAFGTLPEKPTAPGGKWTNSQEQGGGRMPFTSKLELTLSKVEADSFEIVAAGTVEKPAVDEKEKGKEGEEEEGPAAMMKSAKISNGKISAYEKVSRQDGFVVESSTKMSMDVDMEMPGMGSMQMGMKSTKTTKRTTAEAAMAKKTEAPKTGAEAKKDEPKKEEKKEEPKK